MRQIGEPRLSGTNSGTLVRLGQVVNFNSNIFLYDRQFFCRQHSKIFITSHHRYGFAWGSLGLSVSISPLSSASYTNPS